MKLTINNFTPPRCRRCHHRCALAVLLLASPLFLAACAFDISHIRQEPAAFEAGTFSPRPAWTLNKQVTVYVGSGFPTTLKAGTRWTQTGRIAQGDVFRTHDQLVEVEASNLYEACVVLHDNAIAGFYLPVEHAFTAARPPVPVDLNQP